MKKNESKTAKANANFSAMMAVVMLSVLFLLMGGIMLLFPGFELKDFTYVVGGFFLVSGAWEVTRYFLKEEYRNLANYDFSIGVLLLIVGCIIILRAETASGYLYMLIGALVLAEGVTLLQYTVDLKALHSGGWWATLLGAVALFVLSFGILLDINGWFSGTGLLLYPALIAAGVIGLVALFCVGLRVRHFEEDVKRHKMRELEDDIFVPAVKKEETTTKKIEDSSAKKALEYKPTEHQTTEKKVDKNDLFEEEDYFGEEPKADGKGLKDKILSLKERKKKKVNDEIFEDEDAV